MVLLVNKRKKKEVVLRNKSLFRAIELADGQLGSGEKGAYSLPKFN